MQRNSWWMYKTYMYKETYGWNWLFRLSLQLVSCLRKVHTGGTNLLCFWDSYLAGVICSTKYFTNGPKVCITSAASRSGITGSRLSLDFQQRSCQAVDQSLRNREWLPGELLSWLERRRPSWFRYWNIKLFFTAKTPVTMKSGCTWMDHSFYGLWTYRI